MSGKVASSITQHVAQHHGTRSTVSVYFFLLHVSCSQQCYRSFGRTSVAVVPKALEALFKGIDSLIKKDRREKAENERNLRTETEKGEEADKETRKTLDELRRETEQDVEGTQLLTDAMREQGEALRRLAEDRRRDLAKIEQSMAQIDGLLQGLETRVRLTHVTPAPALPLIP